jgi:dTDP-4-amino-4,6-dideoxygalactose transaminase
MIDQEDVKAVSETLASGIIAQGEKVEEFENKLAQLIGAKHAVACSSGTSAGLRVHKSRGSASAIAPTSTRRP